MDLRISQLPPLSGADLAATDVMAVADLSASETKKVTSKDLVQSGVALIDNGTIPGAKLVADSVTAREVAPNAITASELANNAVDTAAVQDSSITNAKLATGIDGGKLSNDTVTAAKIPAASLDRGLNKTSGAIGHANAITAATRSGISFDAQGHITAHTALIGADLPLATATDRGAVNVPATGGLSVSGVGALSHTNNVAAATASGITYDKHGHIVSVVPLAGADLPDATTTNKGAVMVPNLPLQVAAGVLTHADSGVAPGAYPKVTVNAKGHVTAGASLTAGDIPDLDASKIATGTFGTVQIANRSITQQKLADYAIAYIQEGSPGSATGSHPIGELWFQESTAKLAMWNGNSWMPVGQGALSDENMRFCGLFNAATGLVTAITPYGTVAGLTVGGGIPTANNQLTGVYLACDTAGTHDGKTYDVGDWIMCLGQARGWERLDLAAGGGGGGASKLSDLVDVTITTPSSGDVLHFNGTTWVNGGIPDPGTY